MCRGMNLILAVDVNVVSLVIFHQHACARPKFKYKVLGGETSVSVSHDHHVTIAPHGHLECDTEVMVFAKIGENILWSYTSVPKLNNLLLLIIKRLCSKGGKGVSCVVWVIVFLVVRIPRILAVLCNPFPILS